MQSLEEKKGRTDKVDGLPGDEILQILCLKEASKI